MKSYIVEYFEGSAAQYFICEADDPDHAVEQCSNAYPDAAIGRVGLIKWEEFNDVWDRLVGTRSA